MIVEVFLIGWLLGGLVANIITIIVQKAKYKVRINNAVELLSQEWYSVLRKSTIRKVLSILKGDEKNENE